MPWNRDIFFDNVRPIFGGKLTEEQVTGMNAILDVAEAEYADWDPRWVAYPLATTKWETSSTMMPIEEYGKGEGMSYGKKDPETGEVYYGRGYVQLTWRDNYAKADVKLGLSGESSCEWHADNALDPDIASAVMYVGMEEGWFRSSDGTPNTLGKYFNDTRDDPYTAREIINGDKAYKKDWLPAGVTVGDYIAGDHRAFLVALNKAYVPEGRPPYVPTTAPVVSVVIRVPVGVKVEVEVIEDADF